MGLSVAPGGRVPRWARPRRSRRGCFRRRSLIRSRTRMRTRLALLGVLSVSVVGAAASAVFAQQGVAARAGQAIDGVGRGIRQEAQVVGEAVRKRFDAVRTEVNRMGIHSRVYSRLHWDKALNGSRIEVHILRGGTA